MRGYLLGLGERFLAVLFILSTILYAFVLPPFEVPDEPAHFAKAAQLAFWTYPTVEVAGQPGAMLPANIVQLIQDWPHTPIGEPVIPQKIERLAAAFSHSTPSREVLKFADFATLGSYPPILYVPQAIGLQLGRLFGLPPLGQFYAGRIASCLAAYSFILLAVAMLPIGARTVLVLACLPGVSSQMSSYSADTMIFGLSFLSFSIILRAENVFSIRMRYCLLFLLPLLTMAKGVYLPIAAAGFGSANGRSSSRLIWIFAGSIIGVAAFILWFGTFAGGAINQQHFVSSRTLQHAVSATPSAQLHFMIMHPVFSIVTIFKTMLIRLPAYAAGIIGRFGWLNVLLPVSLYVLAVTVLLGAVIVTDARRPMPTLTQRVLWLGLAILMYMLVHCALYLTASELGEDFVEGVQGRYFVPLLPPMALAALWRGTERMGRVADVLLPVGVTLLMVGGLTTATSAFWHI